MAQNHVVAEVAAHIRERRAFGARAGAVEMIGSLAALAFEGGAVRLEISLHQDGAWRFTGVGRDGQEVIAANGKGGPRPSGEPIPYEVRKEIFRRDGRVCCYCGDTSGPHHIDHIHPVSRGGSNNPDNLAVACAPCNLSKSDKLLSEWTPGSASYGKPIAAGNIEQMAMQQTEGADE